MLVAVISDIHGNVPALRAVLEHIDSLDPAPEQIWCLGDIVGYGADPDACTALTAERADVCLAGNHDLVVSGAIDIEYFAQSAREAALWTIDAIDERTRLFLEPLKPSGQAKGVGLYHASPRDPVWEYVLSIDQARACLALQDDRVCLIGHSHVALYFKRHGLTVTGDMARAGISLDIGEGEWLINPGSVGQPRDADPRAAYLLLDTEAWRASFERVDYPIDEAADAILAAGLPAELAQRLHVGH